MSKRKLDELEVDEILEAPDVSKGAFKNSLDSDEEDDEAKEENYDVMHENDFEGSRRRGSYMMDPGGGILGERQSWIMYDPRRREPVKYRVEDGPSAIETNTGFTAFNMKEELEEGHFDKQGHYHWKKEKEIRDNWLDNIDWLKVKPKTETGNEDSKKPDKPDKPGDGEGEGSDEENDFMFDSTPLYKQILSYLKPGESVSKALCRLGKGKKKLTTAERWKRKKDPNAAKDDDENSVKITKLTEIANELLTRTGNMDIYQETYEQIEKIVAKSEKHAHPSKIEAELDMYSDDFESKEKVKIGEQHNKSSEESTSQKPDDKGEKNDSLSTEVSWELKWSQDEKAKIHGPHTSEQMHTWASEGYFKNGAWVRRTGQEGDFYNASRIDFELYI